MLLEDEEGMMVHPKLDRCQKGIYDNNIIQIIGGKTKNKNAIHRKNGRREETVKKRRCNPRPKLTHRPGNTHRGNR
jgi:hypothetical protein